MMAVGLSRRKIIERRFQVPSSDLQFMNEVYELQVEVQECHRDHQNNDATPVVDTLTKLRRRSVSSGYPQIAISPRREPDRAFPACPIDLLTELGKHKGGVDSCFYICKLADIDLDVLEKLIKLGVSTLKKTAAEKNWPVSET